ncbi:MAG: hypothetical protein QOJ09_2769 [Actinomycetota bacterium]|jgi:hypothetical protein|nr:hypothetical protein [Actinomycetota bacterium]
MQRHDLDPLSLVSGVLFAGLGILFLLDEAGSVTVQPRWVWPLVLIALGVAGLLASRPKPSDRDPDF